MNELALSAWQARQAAMLHTFASLDYLQSLHALTTKLIHNEIDPLIALAHAEGRALGPFDRHWGARDPFTNWASHGWDFLTGLQAKLADDIGKRRIGVFRPTDVLNSLRRGDNWLVPYISEADEERYVALERLLGMYADPIDSLFSSHQRAWNDFDFALYAGFFASLALPVAAFRIRIDVTGESGQPPPQTGVYVSATDPNASLQFAVAGAKGSALRPATTFNAVGLDALRATGRASLWLDEQKMLHFALYSPHAALFEPIESDGVPCAALAPSAIASHAFIKRSDSWYLVEAVAGQFEDAAIAWSAADRQSQEPYGTGGEFCQVAGWYRSQAMLEAPSWRGVLALFGAAPARDRRFFRAGEQMAIAVSGEGPTVWRWDSEQRTPN